MFFHKRILVAMDFSECSKVALDIGVSASMCMKTELYVLNTIEKLPRDYSYLMSDNTHSNMKHKLEEKAINMIKAMLPKELPETGKVYPVVKFGKPFVEIIQVAKEKDVDIILIGTHGRAGVDRIILVSVAERVVRKAHCPVMVVRRKKFTGFKRIIVPVDFSDCSRKALKSAIAIAKAHKSNRFSCDTGCILLIRGNQTVNRDYIFCKLIKRILILNLIFENIIMFCLIVGTISNEMGNNSSLLFSKVLKSILWLFYSHNFQII